MTGSTGPRLAVKDGIIVYAPPQKLPEHHALLCVEKYRERAKGDEKPLMLAIISHSHVLSDEARIALSEAFFYETDIIEGNGFTIVSFPSLSSIDGSKLALERVGCAVEVIEYSPLEMRRSFRDALTGKRRI
jgi:hypothetical protein